jgi:hypothetical protein
MRLNRNPEIVFRPLVDPVLCREMGILRRVNGSLSPAAQIFHATFGEVWKIEQKSSTADTSPEQVSRDQID